jgi:Zn-finger nucleic acid-binding protein
MYYRCYITYDFLGYLFNLHNSNICRLFKLLEPIVAKVIHIQKDKNLTEEIVYDNLLIIDTTEQKIQRPSKNQKKYYSEKKKQHNLKTTIVINEKNKINFVSKTYEGSIHNLNIFKKEISKIPKTRKVFLDKGYIGINKAFENTKNNKNIKIEIPIKKNKKQLTKEEKEYNNNISKIRIKVEHKFAEIKSFNILSHTYRNSNKRYYNMRFNIICGITNIKNGFWDLNEVS